MSLITVSFKNPVTDRTMMNAQVDTAMTVREVIQNLVDSSFIAPPKSGQHYILAIKGKTELVSDDATLESGGIASNDMITVSVAQRGGGI